jgi:hypothetical protein
MAAAEAAEVPTQHRTMAAAEAAEAAIGAIKSFNISIKIQISR